MKRKRFPAVFFDNLGDSVPVAKLLASPCRPDKVNAVMDFRLLYITTSKIEEARKIGTALVEARLVACANIIPGLESIYWWQGSVVNDSEVLLVVKTRAEHVEAVIDKVKELHSYTCPCVVAMPILAGNPDYMRWLETETADVETANKPAT